MATAVTVTSAAFAAVVAGPLDVYFQSHGPYEVKYRVATTAAQSIDADAMVLAKGEIHPVRIPDGSSLYARVREKASDASVKVSYTETFLGPEA